MKAYKGFNQEMTCRGFQYKEGETYETARAQVCDCGFHACEYPLDCFYYYAPGKSVFHEVELDGKTSKREDSDTKVAATKIKIGARLSIKGLVESAVEYVKSKVIPGASSDEDHGSASATGYNSAASATGYNSAASADNETAIGVAWGLCGKAKGVKGAHIVLADWRWCCEKSEYVLHGACMVRIDGEKYKPDTWYTMHGGKIVEAEDNQ